MLYKDERMFYNDRERRRCPCGGDPVPAHSPATGRGSCRGEDESDLRCIALKAKLRAAVESAIHEGMEHFICGMAEGCDLYFAETVLALKSTYPHITLEAAIPCPSQADGWGEAQKSRYRDILARCDYETMVQQSYTPGCMQRRNRYMVC